MLLVVEAPNPITKAQRAGLVAVRVMVTRGGRSFEQTVWKRPDEIEAHERSGASHEAPAGKEGPALVVSDHDALDAVPDLRRELGTPHVSRVAQHTTDRHVFEHLLHDAVFGLLGGRDAGRLVHSETVSIDEHDAGLFPGDGEHHAGRVHVRRYAFPAGVVTIKRNHSVLKIHLHKGSLDRPAAMREVVKFKIRDRRYDGSPRANDSPLTDWLYHGPTDRADPHAVELSIYSRDPDRYHRDHRGDRALGEFLAEPFSLAGSEAFLPAWRRAFELAGDPGAPVFPGQASPSLPGVAQHFTLGVESLLRDQGYSRIDNLPSHWNVVHFLRKTGYRTTNPDDDKALGGLREALDHLNAARLARGELPLTRAQESWVVLLQSPAFRGPGVPPPELDLGGKVYPLWLEDDGAPRNIWMSKSLVERRSP